MRVRHRRQQPEKNSPATTKRKNSSISEQSREDDTKAKKRTLAHRRKETITLQPDPYPTLNCSNKFEPIRCCSSSFRGHKGLKKKKSRPIDGFRQWVFSSRDFSYRKDKVVVASYNILGVENASKHPDLYFNVPPKFLEWDTRKHLICKEMNHYTANVLCFQEVDRFQDLDDLLQKDGFRGVFKGRTGEACDGCAIFWKDKLFTLLYQENIEFRSFGLRDNVAQLCILEMNQEQSESELCLQVPKKSHTQSRSILVGNIHVLFNPNRGDIKLGQVRLFLQKAYKLSEEWGNIPVILAGDLNSIPQSAIYQFVVSSELDIRLHDRRKISGQIECPPRFNHLRSENINAACSWKSASRPWIYRWSNEEIRLATGSEGATHVRHQLKLHSAYLGIPGSSRTRDNHGEPLATSYHSKFMGTVDYIWHTEDLVPVRVLETLSMDVLRKSRGLPCEKWGSDHLALVCELAFADDISSQT